MDEEKVVAVVVKNPSNSTVVFNYSIDALCFTFLCVHNLCAYLLYIKHDLGMLKCELVWADEYVHMSSKLMYITFF